MGRLDTPKYLICSRWRVPWETIVTLVTGIDKVTYIMLLIFQVLISLQTVNTCLALLLPIYTIIKDVFSNFHTENRSLNEVN